MYPLLFTPITINTLQIKNRIAYPALGLLYSYDSLLNDRYYEYFREKAKGGAGLVTVGPVGIDIAGSGMMALSLADDDKIPSFKKLTTIIKSEGAQSFVQLFHAGAYSYSKLTDDVQPIAPSSVYSKYSKKKRRGKSETDTACLEVRGVFLSHQSIIRRTPPNTPHPRALRSAAFRSCGRLSEDTVMRISPCAFQLLVSN